MTRSTRSGSQPGRPLPRSAVSLDKIQALLNRAQIYQSKGQSDDAIKALDQLLRLAPENAQALFSKCQILSDQKRFDRLLFDLGRYDAENLSNSVFAYIIGLNFHDLTRYDKALAFLTRAIALDPAYTMAKLLAAETYAEIGKPDQGLEMLASVTASSLRNSKDTITYASVLAKLGQHGEALAVLERLRGDAEVGEEAIQEIAKLPASFWPQDLEQDIAHRLSRGGLSDNNRQRLLFAAGTVADQHDDIDKAFSHFEQANCFSPRTFDASTARHSVATLTGIFDAGFAFPPNDSPSADLTPVFIVGLPRAGKTVLEVQLSRHPEFAVAGERGLRMFIDEDIFIGADSQVPGQLRARLDKLSATKRQHYAQSYLDAVLSSLLQDRPARFVTNTLPVNFWNAGVIRIIFPNARFINVTRHPMDTGLACYMKHFRNDYAFTSNLEWFGLYHGAYQAMCAHWRTLLKDQWLDVSYESLLSDPASTLAAVFEFLGMEERQGAAPAGPQLTNRHIGQWRRYEHHLKPLIACLHRLDSDG